MWSGGGNHDIVRGSEAADRGVEDDFRACDGCQADGTAGIPDLRWRNPPDQLLWLDDGNEEAHQIGKELADRLLEGKYSYVLTTHTDKGHVHNHLIFCSADNITFSHYHDCKKNYWKIRNLSDTLCQEHNLSTIMPDGKKGMKYNEWAANKSESSKKAQLRKDINQTIRIVSTYSEFLAFMEAKGYEIKNAEFGESSRNLH